MKPTLSAMYKWMEHFPEHDIAYQFANARGMSPKRRKAVINQTPSWGSSIIDYKGTYRLISPCGALFVVRKPELIVDVFPLIGADNLIPKIRDKKYRASISNKQESTPCAPNTLISQLNG